MEYPEILGATMYVPALHKDAVAVLAGTKVPRLRSVVLCTEDSIREDQVEPAMERLELILPQIKNQGPGPQVFLRPRHQDILRRIVQTPGSELLKGFVLPKVSPENLEESLKIMEAHPHHQMMVTLETRDAIEPDRLRAIRSILLDPQVRPRVKALRIGGNDLMNLMGLRRPKHKTLYDTPMGWIISQIVTVFAPDGFSLTAPVFERLDDEELLRKELAADLQHGLVGKTAIHPRQVPLIDSFFRVEDEDVEIARHLLSAKAEAVFQMGGAMCEVSTHGNWAHRTLRRAELFGTMSQDWVEQPYAETSDFNSDF
jgi:citrate lyase beta subunit